MSVLVTGATGQLGYDVCRELGRRQIEYKGVSSKDFDLSNPEATYAFLHRDRPDAIIHCAAYTAVDKAEDDCELCRKINAGGTESVARYCGDNGIKLVYISTDYVFPGTGDRAYETWDQTGALNVYGATKLEGEEAVRRLAERHYIVRISWVFGIHGKNFVRTMLSLGEKEKALRITGDQFGSPTYTADLALLLCDMIETEKYGTYHATNEGICTWAEFAAEIFRQAGMDVQVTPRAAAERPSRAQRPCNSRLSKSSLDEAGFHRLPAWQDALARYLEELKREIELGK